MKHVLAALPPTVEKVLSITWILKWVDHAESVEEALRKFEQMGLPDSDVPPPSMRVRPDR